MKCNRLSFLGVMVATMSAGVLQGADVAILNSDQNAKLFFARHYAACTPEKGLFYLPNGEEYQRYYSGWKYVLENPQLEREPIPYQAIKDDDVTGSGLAQYKLLILSNTVSLSDEQEKAIQQWVIRGGRLLATFGSGYKDIISDPKQADDLKLQKGGTGGLHELWQDPLTKLFGSNPVNNGAGTDVRITQYVGPTAGLKTYFANDIVLYGAESNLLVHRPENYPGALGFVLIKGVSTPRPSPAILMSRAAHGLVVYFAFAPEYLVSKEFSLPKSLSCPDGQNWQGRSHGGRILMEAAVRYLLNN